jgi:cytochrome c oxidase subunit 2
MLDRTRRPTRWAGLAALAPLVLLLAACGDDAEKQQSSLDPKGPAAQEIMNLFTPFFWVAVVIGLLVLGAVIYIALRFRARPGHDDNPKQLHGSTPLEVGWTIVPALILAVMAVPTVATIFNLAEKPTDPETVRIALTGKQWWWQYEYVDAGFVTANEMHIPVDTPVELAITSDNVIHSFWVPNLAGKRDLRPGHVEELTIEASEVGVYWGQCAEYCGLSHANMRLRVIAHTRDDYETWLESQQQPLAASALAFVDDEQGPIARYGCTNCHVFEPDATGIGPNLTHVGDRETFAGAIYELDEENLNNWVHDAPSMKPMSPNDGVGMPSFASTMTDEDADALVRFLLCDTTTTASEREVCR